MFKLKYFWILSMLFITTQIIAQKRADEKFKQLYEELPTPNQYHNAAGAPGHEYWQQRADYDIKVAVNDKKQQIHGEEVITYYNNSPDELTYLWVQLDQNVREQGSDAQLTRTSRLDNRISPNQLSRLHNNFDGGFKIKYVKDKKGNALAYTINKTMMRIELPTPLKPKSKFSFQVKWWYNVNDGIGMGGRSGYEYFPKDQNYMYNIAQFYPRMCAYNSVDGWQNKQFLGRGEFTLSFGNYNLEITVPSNFVVAATGELQNSKEVLSKTHLERLEKAKIAEDPVMIITTDEATKNQTQKTTETKTWKFKSKNVRDVGFAASSKLIWDAQGVKFGDRTVMAMSYYPPECIGLWDKYSTRAVVHTLKVYSRYTFDYPYPVAISTHANFTGMEYPMICFNYGRPRPDGTYSERLKYGMIGVIIHEVGHNYFPMIVNSDERQWTWMDEGLNTFLQYLTEVEWERDYPVRRGPAHKITAYMGGNKKNIVPIMTNSESILQFGNNAYGKPATALNILRETIMGRELFDYAFKEYAKRWKFKHPTPADFFRTMEDASGVDLDWFWRGWFYSTDHVDIALNNVQWFHLNTFNAEQEFKLQKKWDENNPKDISRIRNDKSVDQTVMEKYPHLRDKYNDRDPYKITPEMKQQMAAVMDQLSDEEREILEKNYHYYQLDFENVGGLIMPIIIQFIYEDGSSEIREIPVEIWRYNSEKVSKVFFTKKIVKEFILDPYLQTADVDRANNYFPARNTPTRFEMYRK